MVKTNSREDNPIMQVTYSGNVTLWPNTSSSDMITTQSKISGRHSVSIQIPSPNHIRLEVKTLISVQILTSNQVTVQR